MYIPGRVSRGRGDLGNTPAILTAGSFDLCCCNPSILAPLLEALLDQGTLFRSVGILHHEENSFPAIPGEPESGTVGAGQAAPMLAGLHVKCPTN